MNLIREEWKKSDAEEFEKYLLSFSRGEEAINFEKKISNTSLPCIAVPTPKIKEIAREISKGNFLSFIDLWLFNNLAEASIIGILLSKIKDFEKSKKYLTKYANKIDNWANCDVLKIKINDKNEENYFCLIKDFLNSPKPFVRRVGIIILFEYINREKYKNEIFNILNSLKFEKEYYVNMAAAWLLCEMFVKNREITLKYFKNNTTNAFLINKAISKCRDSFRVTNEDKELLRNFRKK